MKEINTYSNIMNAAIKSNTLTNDELRNSSLYSEYWLACKARSKAIVCMNYSKTELVRLSKAWDFEDLCEEFTLVLVRKFQAQINAMLNPKPDKFGVVHAHNHNAYTTAIFTNWINDLVKPLEIKKKEHVIGPDNKDHFIYKNVTHKDINGNEIKEYYSMVSLSTPITNDDSLALEDKLEDDTYSPEANLIIKEEEKESNDKAFETLKKMLNAKKYLGCIYVYIEDELMRRRIPCSLQSMMTLFENAESNSIALLSAQEAMIAAFNSDLKKYINVITNNISNKDINAFINSFSDIDFSKFGRNFTLSIDSVYHRRNEYKLCISHLNDTPKKHMRKTAC